MTDDGVTVHLTEQELLFTTDTLMVTAYRHQQSGNVEAADQIVELRNKFVDARHDALAGDDTQAGE